MHIKGPSSRPATPQPPPPHPHPGCLHAQAHLSSHTPLPLLLTSSPLPLSLAHCTRFSATCSPPHLLSSSLTRATTHDGHMIRRDVWRVSSRPRKPGGKYFSVSMVQGDLLPPSVLCLRPSHSSKETYPLKCLNPRQTHWSGGKKILLDLQ